MADESKPERGRVPVVRPASLHAGRLLMLAGVTGMGWAVAGPKGACVAFFVYVLAVAMP